MCSVFMGHLNYNYPWSKELLPEEKKEHNINTQQTVIFCTYINNPFTAFFKFTELISQQSIAPRENIK